MLIWQVTEALETLVLNVASLPYITLAGEFGNLVFSNYVSLALIITKPEWHHIQVTILYHTCMYVYTYIPGIFLVSLHIP